MSNNPYRDAGDAVQSEWRTRAAGIHLPAPDPRPSAGAQLGRLIPPDPAVIAQFERIERRQRFVSVAKTVLVSIAFIAGVTLAMWLIGAHR